MQSLDVVRFGCTHGLRQTALRRLGLVMRPEVLLAEEIRKGWLVAVLP